MPVVIFLIGLLVVLPARAEEQWATCHYPFDDLFGEQTPDTLVRKFRCDLVMEPDFLERFDTAAVNAMYEAICGCLKFRAGGKVVSLPYPLDTKNRILLFKGLMRGIVKPLRPRLKS